MSEVAKSIPNGSIAEWNKGEPGINVRAITAEEVTELTRDARSGDEEAGAVLRVLARMRDDECRACEEEFTRRNPIGFFLVIFAGPEVTSSFRLRAVLSALRCGRSRGGGVAGGGADVGDSVMADEALPLPTREELERLAAQVLRLTVSRHRPEQFHIDRDLIAKASRAMARRAAEASWAK